MFDYNQLPEHMRGAVQRYLENGTPPGGFLTAVICNDLVGALSRVDHINARRLQDFVRFFYNEAPGNSWGSREKMEAWMEARQNEPLAERRSNDDPDM